MGQVDLSGGLPSLAPLPVCSPPPLAGALPPEDLTHSFYSLYRNSFSSSTERFLAWPSLPSLGGSEECLECPPSLDGPSAPCRAVPAACSIEKLLDSGTG